MVSDERVTGGGGRIPRRRQGIRGTEAAATPFVGWRHERGGDSVGGAVAAAVSARKLASSLWRLAATTSGGGSVRWQCGLSFDRLGFQFCSSIPIPKFATEGATKWDHCNTKARDDSSYLPSNLNLISAASARQVELFKTRKQVNKLEAERGWPKTKSRDCMNKLNEERASPCMKTEHQKMCSVIENLADGLQRERKNCKNIDKRNSKLLRDIADAKLSARRLIQNLENEKKAREELEDVCVDLAKEIESNKAEIGELRNQRKRIQLEVEEERKILQVAEVWREEHAQMKLADAKSILEAKYAEISDFISDLKAFLRRLNLTTDVNASKAKVVRQDCNSIDSLQGVENFKHKLPKSDNTFSIIKDSAEKRSAGHCFSHDQVHYASVFHNINPEINDATRKSIRSNGLTGGESSFQGTIGTETVTQAEIYSSQTPGETQGSVNKIRRRKYISKCDTELNHGSQKSEASEISSVSLMQSKKKGSSARKLQRASPRNNDDRKKILINETSNRSRSSIISMASPRRVSGERPLDFRRNPHVVRAMKGHIEWPRGIRSHRLAANLLEAKLESQKTLLRNVLKQRR